MSLFEWKPVYSMGIDVIDSQHKTLVKCMNGFYDAHLNGDYELAKRALQELLKFTVKHFEAEEKMMQRYNYPDYEQHTKVHKDLLRLVSALADEYMEKSDDRIFERLSGFLKRWLSGHILSADRGYSKYFLGNGTVQAGKFT